MDSAKRQHEKNHIKRKGSVNGVCRLTSDEMQGGELADLQFDCCYTGEFYTEDHSRI